MQSSSIVRSTSGRGAPANIYGLWYRRLVITSLDRARDLHQPPARIAGASRLHLIGGDVLFNYHRADLTQHSEAYEVRRELWSQCGLYPRDEQH